MAVPASFDQSNHVFGKPPDLTDDQCGPLSVWVGDTQNENGDLLPTIISCHKLTAAELQEVKRTGRIWVGVLSNLTMQPIWVSGHNPFNQTPDHPHQ